MPVFVGKYLRSCVTHDGKPYGYSYYCYGCQSLKVIPTNPALDCDTWKLSSAEDKPTFHPSILTRAGKFVCHSWVENGTIRYLEDCTHEFKGKTLPMKDLTEGCPS